MRVGGRHDDVFHRALQLFGDLLARVCPHILGHIAQIGIQEGRASQTIVEYDCTDVQMLMFVLTRRRVRGVHRRSDVHAGCAGLEAAAFRDRSERGTADEKRGEQSYLISGCHVH
jgi:hypothetical protein